MPTPEIHQIILDKAKTCIDNLQRVISVASAGGVITHEQLSGYQDWEAELEILNGYMPACTGDIAAQLTTMEAMMPGA